ncbi:hypothetical protein [Azospirillum doebereinerae]
MGGAIPPPVAASATTPATAPAAAPVPVGEATVVALPDRLQGIDRPVVLTGTVIGQTPEGLTRIRTAAGEVRIDSPVPLPADKPVTLQITPGQILLDQGQNAPGQAATQAKPTALILLQNLPTPGAATGTPQGPTPTAPTGNAATPAVILPTPAATTTPTLPMLTPGAVVPALVLAAATTTKPIQVLTAGGPPLPTQPSAPGTPAAQPSSGPTPPAAPGASPPAAAPPMTGGGAAPLGAAPMLDTPVEMGGDAAHPGAETPTLKPATPPANPEVPDLPRGATVALRILTVTPPPVQPKPPGQPDGGAGGGAGQGGGGQAPAAPQPPADAFDDWPSDLSPDTPVLRGTVAGTTPQGQPILATKQGMLALNVPASLPQGAKVTAALADLAQATQAAAPLASGDLGPLSEREWPAMRQLMATLAAADPALARSMLATMPQPNRKLTAALTFFLSAMRGGDAQGWLGSDARSALEKGGHGDLLARLDREFEGLKREAAEPMPGDWRPYTVPMMDANGPRPIKLHVHPLKSDEENGEGRETSKPGSRFLIDVDLSRLGPMQLDGLVRPNHFDLILRSHVALPPELRVELIQVFADSVRALGYTGGLSFQSGAKSWVKLTRAGKGALGVSA